MGCGCECDNSLSLIGKSRALQTRLVRLACVGSWPPVPKRSLSDYTHCLEEHERDFSIKIKI